jgi:Ca2+-binding RTX toxin-like protein
MRQDGELNAAVVVKIMHRVEPFDEAAGRHGNFYDKWKIVGDGLLAAGHFCSNRKVGDDNAAARDTTESINARLRFGDCRNVSKFVSFTEVPTRNSEVGKDSDPTFQRQPTDDTLEGNSGNNSLFGGQDNDRLIENGGDANSDRLFGNLGADTFDFSTDGQPPSGFTQATADHIGDFSDAQGDRVDLFPPRGRHLLYGVPRRRIGRAQDVI